MNKDERALVKETKALIQQVESGETEYAAWLAIRDRVGRLYEGRSHKVVGELLGKSHFWVGKILRWSGIPGTTPFGGQTAEQKGRGAVEAQRVALDRPEDLVVGMPTKAIEKLAQTASDALVERARASHREQETTPTVRELTGGERFDPAEFWADKLIIRLNSNAHELASLIKRGGGLLLGAMPPEKAHEYLHEAEQLIAEARAAAQEQARDRVEV